MSTIHANTPIDTLLRLETCAIMSGIDFPLSAIRALRRVDQAAVR